MKKSIFIFGIFLLTMMGCKNEEKKEVVTDQTMDEIVSDVIDDHNSQNALDWAGVYEGTTPCADCEGIKTVLEITNDNTYTLSMIYLGKPESDNEYSQKGSFKWDDSGMNIILKTDGEPMKLKVGENQIWMLDGDGNVIDGEIGELFILKKKV